MSKTLSILSITRSERISETRWEDARDFLKHNPNFSSCQVFSSNKEQTYFLVRNKNDFYRYTMRNGALVYTQKE